MKYTVFWIPAFGCKVAESELNSFLANTRVVSIDKEFNAHGASVGWSFCVQWLPPAEKAQNSPKEPSSSRNQIDYKEVLDEPTFRIFAALAARGTTTPATVAQPTATETGPTTAGTTLACACPQLARSMDFERPTRSLKSPLQSKGREIKSSGVSREVGLLQPNAPGDASQQEEGNE